MATRAYRNDYETSGQLGAGGGEASQGALAAQYFQRFEQRQADRTAGRGHAYGCLGLAELEPALLADLLEGGLEGLGRPGLQGAEGGGRGVQDLGRTGLHGLV